MEISTQLKESLNMLSLNQVRAEKMKRSLKEFTKNSWPIIEPSRDFATTVYRLHREDLQSC